MTLRNSIRSWALAAVGVSSAFTIGIAIWLIIILSAQDWCSKALGAAKYATGRPANAIDACFGLMNKQVDTLGTALLIVIGVQGLSLLVLVVIVLAGGKLSFTASKDGVSGDISRAASNAADQVVDAAESEADKIKAVD
jgi:hypothetical protein